MAPSIAIIAGAGSFPQFAAQAAKKQGNRVVIIGLKGWADPALSSHADAYEAVAVGEISRLLKALKTHGVTQAILAGKVTKKVLLDPAVAFDMEAVKLLAQAKDRSVPSLLKAISQRLAAEGVALLDSSIYLKEDLCPSGLLTSRKPTQKEQDDMQAGLSVTTALAHLDVGQTVVVKDRVVIAVEALEGTDAAIKRSYALAGEGLVVVKVSAPGHDRRLDLPVVGAQTIATLKACGVTCLAVEENMTLLLDRKNVVSEANAAKICILGIRAASSKSP